MMVLTENYIGKERLWKNKNRFREIIRLQNRIDGIDAKLSGPNGMKLNDMPRSQNPTDLLSILVGEKIKLEEKLNRILPLYESENMLIMKCFQKMYDYPQPERGPLVSNYVDILRWFYVENKDWDTIAELLNLDKSDDNQQRKLRRWHGKALQILKEVQK